MKKRLALFAAILALVCTAAVRAEGLSGAYLSDYDEALRIIDEYDPFISIIRNAVPDYDLLCEACREQVRARCQSAGDLRNMLAELFARLGNPGHLSMIDAEGFREYSFVAEQGVYGEDTPEYRLIHDAKTRAAYAAMAPAALDEAGWTNRYTPYVDWDPGRGLLYIRLPSFRHEMMARDQNVLTEAFRAHPDAKHIAFDICGNGGGSDYYWADLLVAPFGETVSYEKTVYFRENELTRDYGYLESAAPVSSLDDKEVPDFVGELGMTHARTEAITIERAGEDRAIHTDAKRWVLTDEYVYSAADGFAGFCKQTGWATLIGRRTRGDGGSAAPCLIRLPETGLLMRFTVTADANSEGRLNTFYGTIPDIPSKPSETPRDTLLRVIDG